jgi:acyl-coenzyme A thioesterase PaaI-like protein
MAHAVIAVLGHDVTPMSLEIKVSFFAPVRPGRVIAEGWIERRGKKTAFVEGHLLDPDGNVLAKGSSTVTLFDRGKVEAAAKAALQG